MAKRGRPPEKTYDPIALIETHLSEFDREILSRIAFLSVYILSDYREGKCSEADTELRLDLAVTEIFTHLKERGFKLPEKKVGRPHSLDAILRHLYINHIELSGGSLTEAFKNLSEDITRISPSFSIQYPISKETSKNFWTERRKNEPAIAMMEFFRSKLLEWEKIRTSQLLR